MYGNPAEEWRALTEHYRDLVDEELLELAAEYSDLTPTAQQVLRDELRLRKLGDPQQAQWRGFGLQSDARQSNGPRGDDDGGLPANAGTRDIVEYTWKTPLCECDTEERAWQLTEVLKQAGIESWIEEPNYYTVHQDMDVRNPRVLVAADQLDEARIIAARPIPPEIIEQSKVTAPEYELPVCPKCGAADPVLQDVDPVNAWKCDLCGAEWVDTPPAVEEGAANA